MIMNLTDMDDADAKRLVDFAAGLVFGLHGSIERVTSKVFITLTRDRGGQRGGAGGGRACRAGCSTKGATPASRLAHRFVPETSRPCMPCAPRYT